MSTRFSRLKSVLLPAVLFAATFSLYLTTLAPGMLRGDSGEFQWAMASLNVAHATGYPLFTLVGFGWLQLPLPGAAAWRLNLLSPMFGALAVTTIFVFARSVTRRNDAALIGAIFFALAPAFWFNASILEVYPLNAFFLALILYLLWRWSIGRDVQPNAPTGVGVYSNAPTMPLYLAFFVLGLALAHHRLIVLALPGIFVFLLLTDHRFLFKWQRWIALVLLLLPGLLLYLYVPLRLVAGGESLHYAIFDIVLGQEFSGSFLKEFNPLLVLAQIPVQDFHFGVALAIFGAITLFLQGRFNNATARRNFAILLLLVYLINVAFALVYSVPDIEVFLTPSFVVIAIWIAAGAAFVLDGLTAQLRGAMGRRLAFAVSLVLVTIAFVALTRYEDVRAQVAAEAGTAEARARAILASDIAPGALLELDWETATAIRFLQTTEGARPDLEARLIKLNARDEYLWALKNLDAGRAVYVERGVKWTRALAGYQTEPVANDLARMERASVEIQPLGAKINNQVELVGMRDDRAALILYWRVREALTRDLATYIHYYDADGNALGQEDRAACCEAIFGYRTSEWEPNWLIADSFRAVPPEATYLQIGMYALTNGEIETYGRTLAFQVLPVRRSGLAQTLDAKFNGGADASAYELEHAGTNWRLTLYWNTDAPMDKDYTVFVHLLDAAGKILAQADRQPLDGVYPTSAWQPGQTIRDVYEFPAADGGIKLEFGLYDAATGKRLTVPNGLADKASLDVK